jgi:HD superfamily phosphodiesterase
MISLFILRGKDRDELAKIIAPFVSHERFERLKKHRQHLFFNRYEHLIHTASLCYRIAKYSGADIETAVLSGLLHDFHETRVKGYEHGVEAAENARAIGLRNASADAIIRAHMFPLGFGRVSVPMNREYAVLKTADLIAATVEVAYGLVHGVWKFSFTHVSMKFRATQDIAYRIALEIGTSLVISKREA